ncbi:MAG: type II secretion system F family protein [Actinobacteria bacterium]|nr:type II secretion system F family protein [Actinomycetota bacterium]
MMAAGLSASLVLASALAFFRALDSRNRRHETLRSPAAAPRDWSVPAWFARRVAGAALDISVVRLWRIWLGGFAPVGVVGWWIGGAGLAAMAGAAWAGAPIIGSGHFVRRAALRREQAVPAVLDSIARALRSGASLLQALDEAAAERGPLQAELRRVVSEAERGAGVTAALDAWADRQPTGAIRLAAAALCLGAEMGGANARTVEGVASTVRQRLAVVNEARALTSQARVSAQVIALAPVAFCAVAAATDPDVARMLFTTPVGWAMLAGGLALDVIGMKWMSRMAGS